MRERKRKSERDRERVREKKAERKVRLSNYSYTALCDVMQFHSGMLKGFNPQSANTEWLSINIDIILCAIPVANAHPTHGIK